MEPVATSWKLALDTFCESYHVPAVHGRSLGDQVVPYVSIHDDFGIHGRYIGPGKQLQELVGTPESEWPDSNYSGVHYIFPNATFTYTDSIDGKTPYFTLFRLFPGAHVGEAVCLFSSFRPAEGALGEDDFARLHRELHALVRDEDFVVAANTWRSLQHAPADTKLVFGRHEMILREYHDELARRAGLPLGAAR